MIYMELTVAVAALFIIGYGVRRLILDRKRETICDECGHPISRHGRHGCDVERGDQEIDGCLCAMGPCGCKEFKL